MKPHPYLKAYMAGVVVPTVFLLVGFVVFCIARFGFNPDLPIEKMLVFPFALVPPIWGGWNMLYVALHGRRRLPLGLHGAIVPAFLVPLALVCARIVGFDLPTQVTGAILIVAPLLMIVYYLVWKYLVGFFNDMLGIG